MSFRALVILIPVFLLIACGSGREETPAAAPSSEESAAVAAGEPTASPGADTSQAGGMAGFRDNLATADRFVLALSGLSRPPDGQVYQGWLVGDDGSFINLGELGVGSDGTVSLAWNSPESENMLGRFARFQVTLETTAGGETPSGSVILSGGLEGGSLKSARRLFVKNEDEPTTPLDTAFATGLIAQTDVAVQHVQNALNAAAIGAEPEMRSHLEHVINIIEGAAGPRFGDHDGNGDAENPGDGFGVLGYSEQIATLLADRPDVIEAAIGIQAQSAAIQDLCFEILAIEEFAAASARLGDLERLSDELETGPVARVYQAAQSGIDFAVAGVEE